jgi:hypothetical protein
MESTRYLPGKSFNYAYVPTIGTRGSIILVWRTSLWSGTHVHQSFHDQVSHGALSWWLRTVYGLQRDHEKVVFLQQHRDIFLKGNRRVFRRLHYDEIRITYERRE